MNGGDGLREGPVVDWIRSHAPQAAHLRIDSRAIQPGDVFLALPGRRDDGRLHVADAIGRGAAAIVAERGGPEAPPCPVPMLQVDNLAAQLADIGAAFYRDPTARLLTVGITGTNGKTSSSHWIAQVLTACGRRCGVIGTVGSGFTDALQTDAVLTTPDPIGLQRQARALLDAGAQALAMEVSSIGLDQRRADAIRFDLALFTNLTRDHLDYHGSMGDYEGAKARLFDAPTLAGAVLNLDDEFGARLAQRCRARKLHTTGYRIGNAAPAPALDAELSAGSVVLDTDHIRFDAQLQRPGAPARSVPVRAPVIGRFNVANVLGVLGIALAAGIDVHDAARALERLRPPPGRLQRIELTGRDEPLVLIDYAHTPDAIEQALAALRPVAQARQGRLWIVFGAGGDRDPGKRPQMGAAAGRGADRIVVTSDNPRGEDPARIIDQIVAGAGDAGDRLSRTADRAAAIERTVLQADPSDVVLIAGKGHEQYQEVAGRRIAFSDAQCALHALERRAGRASSEATA
ncbi:MAG TPA: UDP-N-acetylmuramoyl-L-alanyl-D-glutamate--2,6-diaminopimelate ligase [Burkholderiaceae bacterium]|nr:UDP-N-acetylmuramoyl-L-alanyl-D-glutamate--2,6-diaminopimelate ligase [Burkholderiaceae bacterium]